MPWLLRAQTAVIPLSGRMASGRNPGVRLELTGDAEVSLITASDVRAAFTFDKQAQYPPVTTTIRTDKGRLIVEFPLHSFTQIKASIKP